MAVLLDTHTFLWWCGDSPELSANARQAIQNNDCFVSFVSFWEIAIKFNQGKLKLPAAPDRYLTDQMSLNGFDQLEISFRAIMRCAAMPRHHGDPFDRLLVGQAMEKKVAIVSRDPAFEAYGVERIW